MQSASQPPRQVISGHPTEGGPSEVPHLAFVPLPDIGHAHADGHLLGVALVFPRTLPDDDREHARSALAKWLSSDVDGVRIGTLFLGRLGAWQVTLDPDGDARVGVRSEVWAPEQGAVEWASATPVALDRNPGNLLGDRDEQAAAHAAAQQVIAQACEHIGLPAPEAVEVSFRPPWRGAAKVDGRHPPFPRRQDRLRRVLVHARIRFGVPVRGPVLLGAGRYLGLGLFRPVRSGSGASQ